MITNVSTQLSAVLVRTSGGFTAPTKPENGQDLINPVRQKSATPGELNEDQKAQVDRLKKADQEVRAHEAAHKNAGGQHAGSASFSYTVGPDGKRYATGGEVPIDVAPVEGDPEATIAKLDVVIAAALAPAKPSAQDRKIAAAAVAARNQARQELLGKKQEEQSEKVEQKDDFDVNDFGKFSVLSVNKAYENGIDLSVTDEKPTGLNISITS